MWIWYFQVYFLHAETNYLHSPRCIKPAYNWQAIYSFFPAFLKVLQLTFKLYKPKALFNKSVLQDILLHINVTQEKKKCVFLFSWLCCYNASWQKLQEVPASSGCGRLFHTPARPLFDSPNLNHPIQKQNQEQNALFCTGTENWHVFFNECSPDTLLLNPQMVSLNNMGPDKGK